MSLWYSGIGHRKLNDAATMAKHLAFSGHQGVEHQGRETVQTLSVVLNAIRLISRESLPCKQCLTLRAILWAFPETCKGVFNMQHAAHNHLFSEV